MLKLLISTISLAANSGFACISSRHLLQFVPVFMVATSSSGSVDVQILHLTTKTSTFGILLPRMSLWPVLQQYLVENDLQQYPTTKNLHLYSLSLLLNIACIKFKTFCSLNKRLFMTTFPPNIKEPSSWSKYERCKAVNRSSALKMSSPFYMLYESYVQSVAR